MVRAVVARLGSSSCDAAGRELLPLVLLRVPEVASCTGGGRGGCCGEKRRRKKAAADLDCVRVRLRQGAVVVGAAEQRRNYSCCCLVMFLEAC